MENDAGRYESHWQPLHTSLPARCTYELVDWPRHGLRGSQLVLFGPPSALSFGDEALGRCPAVVDAHAEGPKRRYSELPFSTQRLKSSHACHCVPAPAWVGRGILLRSS
jgi:hypothetical protein